MQMSDMKVLLAGCGSIGLRHAQVLQQLGIIQLSACDPSPVSRAAMQARYPAMVIHTDYAAALAQEQPHVVFILTPTRLHMDMAKQAIRAGCHVMIEKPLANTPDGADELVALAEAHGKKVMVAFCFRYHEALCKAKRLVNEGRIGRIVSIRAHMGEPFFDIHPNYLELYYAQYSGAFELVHDLDLAIWFSGQEIKRVQGIHGSFSDMGMHSPDTVEMLIEFQDRCVANVHLDFFQTPRRRQIDLIGVGGVITVEFAAWEQATLSIFTRDTMCWVHETLPTQRNDMFAAEDREFLHCILTDAPVQCTIQEALKSLRAVHSIYQPDRP